MSRLQTPRAPAFLQGVDRLVRLPIVPALGSVPAHRDGVARGTVGCGGATADQDEESALAGVKSPR